MPELLNDPMMQAGVAPFAVALALAALLARVPVAGLAGLALVAGLATTLMLTTGIGFTPLSASRKVLLLVLLAPVLGLVLDVVGVRHKAAAPVLALLLGAAVTWVFHSMLAPAGLPQALAVGGGVALFVALMVFLTLRLRDDGPATAAATLGLGLAVGVSAVLSASLGTLMNGMALAAGGGALLLLQFVRATPLATGWTGALTTAAAAALFAAGTLMLAELRWPALVLMLAVPLAAGLPRDLRRGVRLRVVLLGLSAGAAALLPIAAAWWATGAATAT
jgi:hypothetical protein